VRAFTTLQHVGLSRETVAALEDFLFAMGHLWGESE
jgi:hypothetical protein